MWKGGGKITRPTMNNQKWNKSEDGRHRSQEKREFQKEESIQWSQQYQDIK
jgi:hypothetical protein